MFAVICVNTGISVQVAPLFPLTRTKYVEAKFLVQVLNFKETFRFAEQSMGVPEYNSVAFVVEPGPAASESHKAYPFVPEGKLTGISEAVCVAFGGALKLVVIDQP